VDALGLPESRDLSFSPIAWLLEPFRNRNLNLDSEHIAQAIPETGEPR
jgi:hypothetical protein